MPVKRKYTLNLENIEKDSHEKYYWLGFIAGDGNIAKKEARLRIELKSIDKDQLIHFNTFMESNNPIKDRINNQECACSCLSINSKALKEYLALYNLTPAKSKTFIIPEEKIPSQYIYDFLRGIFDADGCLSFRNKDYTKPILEFTTGNYKCAEQIHNILQLDTSIYHYPNDCAFLVRKEGIAGTYLILEKMYATSTEESRLKRKYELWSLIK